MSETNPTCVLNANQHELAANGEEISIVLIEDNDYDAMAVRRAFGLFKKSFKIEHHTCAQSAYEWLSSHPFDPSRIIILDLSLPGWSGIDFLKAIRKNAPLKESVVYALTASNSPTDLASLEELKIEGHFVKGRTQDGMGQFISELETRGDRQLSLKPPRERNKLVFVVEDEPAVRQFVVLALELGQLSVADFGDAESAMCALESRQPSLLVTDCRLPGINGVDLTAFVSRYHPNTHVVGMSAEHFRGQSMLSAGAERFIEKPIGVQALLSVVSELLPNATG